MSRKDVEASFADGINRFDRLNDTVKGENEREMWGAVRHILHAFFTLACDYVYGCPGENRPYSQEGTPNDPA